MRSRSGPSTSFQSRPWEPESASKALRAQARREVLLEPPEVRGWIVKAVGVVDAQPVQLPLGQQPEDQAMGGFEDVLTLHAEGGQVVDVEEPPVVDLVGGHTPVGQAVALVLQQVVQEVEAPRVARLAVEQRHVLLDELRAPARSDRRAQPAVA